MHQLLVELYGKLAEAESLDAAGDRGITHQEMMRRLKQRILQYSK
jgi:hypothetical protein